MYKLVSLLTATAIFIGFTSFKNHSMQDHKTQKTNEGWITLFDGKTTNGWHTYGMKTAGNVWKVENGVLHLDQSTANKQSGDLVTNDEYKNFDLMLDWKISEKGNSGIIFYVHEDPAKYNETYVTGIEMQILDNGSPTRLGHPDGKYYTHRAGDLYDLMASKEVANPLGQWNNVEIKCKDGKLDFYMNGQHTLSTTLWDQHWKEIVAISKFKDMPAFATFKEGKIALQDHGGDVWFRNIKIKKL